MLYGLLKYEYRSEGIEIVGFEGFPKAVTIPSEIEGKKVTGVSAHSFERLETLEQLSIEQGIEHIGENAFSGCSNLTSVSLPDSIKYIGKDAFSNTPIIDNAEPIGGVIYIDRHLIKAIAPLSHFTVNGIVSIAEEAFIDHTELKEVTFTNELRYISPRAFYNCGITSIKPSFGVMGIGSCAFAECKDLVDAYFPESVELIEEGVFYNTPLYDNSISDLYVGRHLIKSKNNKRVTLKNDTLSIAEGAFAESIVERVDLKNITIIPNCCFYKCTSLRKIKSNPLTDIGEGAFAFCTSLEKPSIANNARLGNGYNHSSFDITHEESVLYLGKHLVYAKELYGEYKVKYGTLFVENMALKGNDRLTSITFPSSVVKIGDGALLNCPFLKRITLSNKLKVIPNQFAPNCELQEIDIPSDVTVIGKEAFYGCEKLKGEITSHAIKLGEGCFYKTQISGIYLKNPIKLIGKDAFAASSALKIIDFTIAEKGVISEGCFKGCRSLTDISIPDGIKKLPSSCFEGCISLKNIHLPESLERIEKRCFYNCKFLEDINLTKQILYASCFENCSSLKSVTVNQERIYPATFKNCTSLERVNLLGNTLSIGKEAFYNTYALKEIIFLPSLEIIEHSGFENSGIQEITLNPSITIEANAFEGSSLIKISTRSEKSTKRGIIGEYAFSNCKALEEVGLPNGIYSIQKNAFANCIKLHKILLNDNLYSIGEGTFLGCDELKCITLPDSLLSIGKNFFTGGKILKKKISPLLKQEHGAFLKLGGNIIEYEQGFLSIPLFGEECFTDNNWMRSSLSAYDSIFALDTQNKELKIDYITQRLLYPYKLSNRNKKVFIAEYLDDIMFDFITKQRLNDIRRLNENNCFSAESVQAYIKYTTEIKAVSVTALLLDILRGL